MIERGMAPPPPAMAGWPGVKAREQELQYEERRLLIEKGLELGAQPGTQYNGVEAFGQLAQLLPKRETPQPEHYLGRGIKTLAFGLGLAAAYVIFKTSGINASDETRNWFLFFAVISPLFAFYGIGNLVLYRSTKKKASAPDPVR
jgi:hypothetical protein